jgi:VanZ family protein
VRTTVRRIWRIALLLVASLLVFVLLAPQPVVLFLRKEFEWLGRLVNWLELMSRPGMNLSHILAFAITGLIARLALRTTPTRVLLLATLVLAVATELAQVWLPGRTPRIGDVLDDAVGALLGIGLATLLGARRAKPKPRPAA